VIPYRVRGDRLENIAVLHGRQKWPQRFQPVAPLSAVRREEEVE
jgi:hypothetical protein